MGDIFILFACCREASFSRKCVAMYFDFFFFCLLHLAIFFFSSNFFLLPLEYKQKDNNKNIQSVTQSQSPWPALGRSGTAEFAPLLSVGDATTPSIRSVREVSVWMLEGVLMLSE
jgi:hypothetical protein